MNFSEFSRKQTMLEKGAKRAQFKFVLLPVLIGIAIVNLFSDNSLNYMLTSALITGLIIGLPLLFFVSRTINNVAREQGLFCPHCDQTFPIKKLKQIAATGRCPNCNQQVLNTEQEEKR